MTKEILLFKRPDGKIPFEEWLGSLSNQKAKDIVRSRLARIRVGLLGDTRSVGQGVCEFRITFGPGYRIYFGQQGQELVILLCGGDKSTQVKDIQKAQDYWADYRRRIRETF